jgi:hypothetical protein
MNTCAGWPTSIGQAASAVLLPPATLVIQAWHPDELNERLLSAVH